MPILELSVSNESIGTADVEVAKEKAFIPEAEGVEEAMVVVAKLLKERRPETNVTWSVIASPKVALFSMVSVFIEVVAKEDPPVRVTDLAKTSPSASTMNLAPPFTAIPKRLVSAAAEEGLTTKGAAVTAELAASIAQAEKVWASCGE